MTRCLTTVAMCENFITRNTWTWPNVCRVSTGISILTLIATNFTGVTIALLRLFFIHFPMKMSKNNVKFNALLQAGAATFTIVYTFLWYSSPMPNRIRDTFCVGVGWKLAAVLFDYKGQNLPRNLPSFNYSQNVENN